MIGRYLKAAVGYGNGPDSNAYLIYSVADEIGRSVSFSYTNFVGAAAIKGRKEKGRNLTSA